LTALKVLKIFALSSALFFLAACSEPSEPETPNKTAITQLSIKNFANPEQSIFTGGQPSQEALTALAKAGVKHVINLRPMQEQEQSLDWNEVELVESLNMQYHSIPVAGAAGVTLENATALADLLKTLEGEQTFLHCASSNRVGALTALYEGAANEVNIDEAIAKGKRWGLSSLEPVVRAQLDNPQ
jgi:protein tyrosine phosphatase (PTP) superfamily phosphohydrolase (DUF442 family)